MILRHILGIFLLSGIVLYGEVANADSSPLKAEDVKIYHQAFNALDNGQFTQAISLARKAHDSELLKVILWKYYLASGSGANFTDITGFIRSHPTWPSLSQMNLRAESVILETTPVNQVIEWFDANPPQTANGVIAYATALREINRLDDLENFVKKAWEKTNFTSAQEQDFLKNFGKFIDSDSDIKRLEYFSWDHQTAIISSCYSRVHPDYQILSEARLALYNHKKNIDVFLNKVPTSLRNNQGLLYEQIRYYRQEDNDDLAISFIQQRPEKPIHPELFWSEEVQIIRHKIAKGQYDQAYALSSHHPLSFGTGFAEAEWLSGWLSLRFLNNPERAYSHFLTMFHHVTTPQSIARASYWLAQSLDQMKLSEESTDWYKKAAQNITTFYGQVALSHLSPENRSDFPREPEVTAEDIKKFDKQELIGIVHRLSQIHYDDLYRIFLTRFAEVTDDSDYKMLTAQLAHHLNRDDIAVSISRISERQWVPLVNLGYPILPISTISVPEKSLILAIIRQESAFQQQISSSAGALGLMQLMPETATKLARDNHIKFQKKSKFIDELTKNPSLNMKLGSLYLQNLIDNFNGSYILAIASYNAGPGRIRRWINDFGDPRDPKIDPIDWIEKIPFSETRGYVQRVLEGLQLYRHKFGLQNNQIIDYDLKRFHGDTLK